MFKFLPLVRRLTLLSLLFGAVSLMSSHALAASPQCANLFRKAELVWPPVSWKSYLGDLARTGSAVQPRGKVAPEVVAEPREDSRLYSQGDYLGASTITNKFHEEDIRSELASVSENYSYHSSGKPHGGPYTIQSKRYGRAFDVFDLPRRSEFSSPAAYQSAVLKYLDRIEALVIEGKTYPEYDVFFDQRRLRWEDEDRKAVSEGRFIGRRPRRQANSNAHSVPVEILEGTPFVRYAYREEYERNGMIVTVIGTRLVGTPHPGEEKLSNQVTAAQSAKGILEHREWVIGLISEIYPDYVGRRHWTKSFIEADFAEVLETLNSTDYVMIRNKGERGHVGSLVAAMGLNRASYGKAQGFDAKTNKWKEITGRFGSSYYDDYADAKSKLPIDASIIHQGSVPLLKMEAYLGEGYRVPRPAVLESITIDQHTPRYVNGEFVGKMPIYMKSGEVFEPVKFYLARKDEQRGVAVTQLFSETLKTLFPSTRSCDVSVCGQSLYTMNPKIEGTRLYSKRGMGLLPQFESKSKDGVEWHVFGSRLEDYVRKFHEPTPAEAATRQDPVKHIDVIRDLTDRVLEGM